jgi:thiamine monophosphate kinase
VKIPARCNRRACQAGDEEWVTYTRPGEEDFELLIYIDGKELKNGYQEGFC